LEGVGPAADSREEVALGVTGKVFRFDFFDGTLIDVARWNKVLLYQFSQPSRCLLVEFVVEVHFLITSKRNFLILKHIAPHRFRLPIGFRQHARGFRVVGPRRRVVGLGRLAADLEGYFPAILADVLPEDPLLPSE